MSGFFKDEAGRASKFREILEDSGIDTSATKIEGTKFKTEGDIQSQGFRRTIIEVKNEIGSKGAQPHAQGISYYIHSTKSSVTGMPSFRFPCILITLFGTLTIFHFYLWCLQPPQVPMSTSRLLCGALVQMYR
jgi:hypothetical protein